LGIASGAGVGEVSLDQRTQAEALVQLARKQQPRVGRDGGAAELDAKLGIERGAKRARFHVTHWMMPSANRKAPPSPHFWRALSDYGPIDSPRKTKMQAN
jgi:hypothetical protein